MLLDRPAARACCAARASCSRGAARVRAGIRRVGGRRGPGRPRAGARRWWSATTGRCPTQVVEDFRTCGLTHLAGGLRHQPHAGGRLPAGAGAVGGVRARGLVVVGVLGVAGFVLLARPEPSVLRAAAMGSVALVGLGARGRDRGRPGPRRRGPGAAAARPVAGALGRVRAVRRWPRPGILFLGPPFRDALRGLAAAVGRPRRSRSRSPRSWPARRWSPRSPGRSAWWRWSPTSLVAAGGRPGDRARAARRCADAGRCRRSAGWCGWLGRAVRRLDRRGRHPPGPAAHGGARLGARASRRCWCSALLCAGASASARGAVLRRPRWSVPLSLVLVVVMLRPLPTPGWPPRRLGAGGLRRRAGRRPGAERRRRARRSSWTPAPTRRRWTRCLDRLGVRAAAGAWCSPTSTPTTSTACRRCCDGRRVGRGRRDRDRGPGLRRVPRCDAGRPRRACRCACPAYGEVRRVGPLTWQVVGPARTAAAASTARRGRRRTTPAWCCWSRSAACGSCWPATWSPRRSSALAASLPGLRVDVLKVPHHGSRYQDPRLLAALGARLALVSVGAGQRLRPPGAGDARAAAPRRDAGRAHRPATATSR